MDPSTKIGRWRAPICRRPGRPGNETVRWRTRPGAANRRPAWVLLSTHGVNDIPKDSPAYRDELFGPVASVFRVKNADEAIALANDTRFGLGASVWTRDEAEVERMAASLDAGQVFVNAMVASDPRVPFGGVKNSGYGRELSLHGIREFVNAKTVWVNR